MNRRGFVSCLCLPLVAGCARRPSGGDHPAATDAAVAAPLALAPIDPEERALARAVLRLLDEHHVRYRAHDEKLSHSAFTHYLSALDPQKQFLLASDVRELERYSRHIDDDLRIGRFELAHEGTALLGRRVAAMQKVVEQLLAGPLDLSNEEWIETDAKKVKFADTEEELRDRWRKQLELDLLERVADMEDRAEGAPPAEARTPEAREAKARADLAASYAARFARLTSPVRLGAASKILNALCVSLDPHTAYLPASEKANFDIQMSGTLEGIGASLREEDQYVRVAEIVPGGASWREGRLEVGDQIMAVTQPNHGTADVANMRLDDVVKLIRGPKGSVVTLTVRKPSGRVEAISITRDVVVVEETYARSVVLQPLGKTERYGYIYLPSFYGGQQGASARSSAEDVGRLLGRMRARGVMGVVIDLRRNGGGTLVDAVDLSGQLINTGPITQTKNRSGTLSTLVDDKAGAAYEGPVVVLVDRSSASASEIVAAAIQDYRRGVVVGTGLTHGKGTVQVLIDLDSEGSVGWLLVTERQFYRLTGKAVQAQGIIPDIVLPDLGDRAELREAQLEDVLPATDIQGVPYQRFVPAWDVRALAAASSARVSENSVFTKISGHIRAKAGRPADTRVPLSKTAFRAQRDAERSESAAAERDVASAPVRLKVSPIDMAADRPSRQVTRAVDQTLARWRDGLARDPWVEECLSVLSDMVRGQRGQRSDGESRADVKSSP